MLKMVQNEGNRTTFRKETEGDQKNEGFKFKKDQESLRIKLL